MSYPTLCSVWEKWAIILLNPGRKQIQWYSDNNYFSELNRIDGQPVEFEWKISPGFTTVGILKQMQQMMEELHCEPENFTGRIIFVDVQRHCMGCKKEMMKFAQTIQRQFKEC